MQKFFTIRRFFVLAFVLLVAGLTVFLWDFFIPPGKILNNLKFFQAGLLAQQIFEPEIQEQGFLNDNAPPQDFQPEESAENLAAFYKAEEQEPLFELSHRAVGEQLDDIAEKLDIIRRQVADLAAENSKFEAQNPKCRQSRASSMQSGQIQNSDDQNLKLDEQEELAGNIPLKPEEKPEEKKEAVVAQVSAGKPSYPKILISEVQIAGVDDSKQEFVELRNPNTDRDVELTGWYLQKKTATGLNWSTYASKNLFNGKKILANGYFLIARTDYYLASADIFTDSPITDDNSFALKNPNADISDQLGFGNAMDPELMPGPNPLPGQSVGRIVLANGSQWETDNNFNDFELQTPTPKMPNITYTAPAVSPEPETEPQDTNPPEVVFMLDAIQAELNFTINFEIIDPFDIVTPSGLASYIFRWQEQGGEWQEDLTQEIVGLPMSYNSGREFEGENGKTYFFQITARDLLGNESGWMPEAPALTTVSVSDAPITGSHIVINEVQINPIGQRFIELYNPNDSDVDLTGYYIQRKTKSGASWSSLVSSPNFEGKAISANNYFLISRELENSDILLDITLSDDNLLVLKNPAGDVLDKLGFGEAQDFETSPAENPLAGQSITRIAGADTDNNSVDFIVFDVPTPGE